MQASGNPNVVPRNHLQIHLISDVEPGFYGTGKMEKGYWYHLNWQDEMLNTIAARFIRFIGKAQAALCVKIPIAYFSSPCLILSYLNSAS